MASVHSAAAAAQQAQRPLRECMRLSTEDLKTCGESRPEAENGAMAFQAIPRWSCGEGRKGQRACNGWGYERRRCWLL